MSVTSEIIAGGDDDFMTVRKVTAAGGQREIGRALAAEAAATFGWAPVLVDPVVNRARRTWFERNWPQHHERMRGAAEAAGVDPDDDRVHLDGLTGVPSGSACSVTYLRPSATKEGHGLFGRNYDFFTTSAEEIFAALGGPEPAGPRPPMASRPYVLNSIPDAGPTTTVLTMNELDGCMEGINEHGLAVALLIADAESTTPPVEAGPQVGISSAQLPRFVLDTCATVDEAKQALLGAKHYDLGVPLHYLIADAAGNAFIWERGDAGIEHIIDIDGDALCLTNHLVHKRQAGELPQDNEETLQTYGRYRTLVDRTGGSVMSGELLRATLDEIGFDATNAGHYPVRTLWRTVFDLDERTMSTRFYLGDTATGGLRHSAELTFGPGLLAG
ncbi:C45 family peptidase [Saccharopolyspora sp. NPDC050642]|uniref:C45 family peptidase n=1 Tax=Saccharopolyspora sp. NPDC050642 TaxID=3157099 RepID=UPI0033C6E006